MAYVNRLLTAKQVLLKNGLQERGRNCCLNFFGARRLVETFLEISHSGPTLPKQIIVCRLTQCLPLSSKTHDILDLAISGYPACTMLWAHCVEVQMPFCCINELKPKNCVAANCELSMFMLPRVYESPIWLMGLLLTEVACARAISDTSFCAGLIQAIAHNRPEARGVNSGRRGPSLAFVLP